MTHWSQSLDSGDYGKSGRSFAGMQIRPAVFFPTACIALAVVLFTVLAPAQSANVFAALRGGVVARFDKFLMLAGNVLLLFCVVVALSPLGRVRLGGSAAKTHYSTAAWFSMLFGAGMGVGLIFYGVAEPITHFASSVGSDAARVAPLGGAMGDRAAARDLAMAATLFDWSLHPWAMYAVVGLGLGLFTYNFNLPLSLRSVFYPLFGKRVWGGLGDGIDILAIFATLAGLATSLGIGAQQAMAGITHQYGIAGSPLNVIGLIAIMTIVTFFSVAGGIDRGIRILSEINMVAAAALMLFVLVTGPTVELLWRVCTNTGHYLALLPALSNPFGRTDVGFYDDWSVYYWAWWLSWAPFVGLFMARISFGRTVREFMLGSLLAPSLLGILWLTVFGDSAIAQLLDGANPTLGDASLETKLFVMLSVLPWSGITSFVTIALILIFFITGWDSGTLVIDTMAAGGRTDTPLRQRVIWLLFVGAIAVTLLLSGGLESLQAGVIATGLPLAAILLLMCGGILRGLLVAATAMKQAPQMSAD